MFPMGRIMIALLLVTAMEGAGEEAANKATISMNGMVEMLTSELLKARMAKSVMSGSSEVDHVWSTDLVGTLNFNATLPANLRLLGSFEFRQYIKISPPGFMEVSYNPGNFLYEEFFIREGEGIVSFVNDKPLAVEMALGYMPYKYNEEARDLGEYLFRSGTYPFYLLGEFDRPFARLAGLRATCRYSTGTIGAHLDLLGLTEREIPPYWDISLAAVADVNVLKIFSLGAGIDFAHCVPVDSRVTTPRTDASGQLLGENMYLKYNSDSTVADTGFYTFKGTKLMARATIDPVGPFRGRAGSVISEIFGDMGGKIYFEGAIIGLENYPANTDTSVTSYGNPYGYDKLTEKMPWMAGINIPFWKIFDVCSFEIEWYPNHYPNSTARIYRNVYPLPYFGNLSAANGFDLKGAYSPRWYWSLYMKKQIMPGIGVVLQFGRDHERWEMPLNFLNTTYDVEEAMVKPDNWGWRLKTEFKF